MTGPPAWVSGISGDGKQVYYKSWPNLETNIR